jgi:hypothetical protein
VVLAVVGRLGKNECHDLSCAESHDHILSEFSSCGIDSK